MIAGWVLASLAEMEMEADRYSAASFRSDTLMAHQPRLWHGLGQSVINTARLIKQQRGTGPTLHNMVHKAGGCEGGGDVVHGQLPDCVILV